MDGAYDFGFFAPLVPLDDHLPTTEYRNPTSSFHRIFAFGDSAVQKLQKIPKGCVQRIELLSCLSFQSSSFLSC